MADSPHHKPDAGNPAYEAATACLSSHQEELCKSLIEQALPDALFIHDHDGRFLKVNSRACASLGYTREELLTMRVMDVEQDFDLASAQAAWSRLESGAAMVLHGHHRRKDGSVFPTEVHFALLEADGQRLYIGIVRDMSTRMHVESELRANERRLDEAQRVARMGSWEWHLKTGEVRWSRGLYAIYGLDPEKFTPSIDAFRPFIHPADRQFVESKIAQIISNGISASFEFRVVCADGSTRVLSTMGEVTRFDKDGSPLVMMGINQDITERKRASQVLEETRNMLAEAQQITHLGSFEYSAASRTPVWSEEQYRIFGLDPGGPVPTYEEMLTRHIHPEDANLVDTAFSAAMKQHGIFELEHRIVRPDGSVRWVYDRAHPYWDEQGNLVRYVGTTLDITERKREESEAQKHNELMQSLARQQVAVQTVAAFAHELNQPLVAISAYSEVALRTLDSHEETAEPLTRAIRGCHAQALRAGRVLHELLDQLHKGETEPSPFDLNQLVNNLVDNMKKMAFRRVQTTLDLEPGLPPVLGNPLQTEKVLANLIRNGIEAMEQAEVEPAAFTIAVRTFEDQRMAHVTVRDNGPGVDADTAGRIFEPFFTTKPNGLGLGLLISRSLIEAQGGRFWLDPEPGSGATFHFTLPLAHD